MGKIERLPRTLKRKMPSAQRAKSLEDVFTCAWLLSSGETRTPEYSTADTVCTERGPYRTWTLPELRRAQKRREANEPTADIAKDLGVTESCLRQAWRMFLGWGAGEVYTRERRSELNDITIYSMKARGATYKEIVLALELPDTKQSWNRVRMRCRRFADRIDLKQHGQRYPSGKGQRSRLYTRRAAAQGYRLRGQGILWRLIAEQCSYSNASAACDAVHKWARRNSKPWPPGEANA